MIREPFIGNLKSGLDPFPKANCEYRVFIKKPLVKVKPIYSFYIDTTCIQNQLEKLEAARSAYLLLPLVTSPYLWSPFLA